MFVPWLASWPSDQPADGLTQNIHRLTFWGLPAKTITFLSRTGVLAGNPKMFFKWVSKTARDKLKTYLDFHKVSNSLKRPSSKITGWVPDDTTEVPHAFSHGIPCIHRHWHHIMLDYTFLFPPPPSPIHTEKNNMTSTLMLNVITNL